MVNMKISLLKLTYRSVEIVSFFNSKKVLFFAPSFFGYEQKIKDELVSMGAHVHYYDERPSNTFFSKLIIRLGIRRLIKKRIDNYYDKIIYDTKNCNFDYLFLVNPETIDIEKISGIKKHHPRIIVLTYMWDSIKNKKGSLSLLPLSDKFFTFDSEDCLIDSKIRFLPLFYSRDYEELANNNEEFSYDLAFVGSLHSDRYSMVKSLSKEKLSVFSYFYSPSRVLFFFQKMFLSNFRCVSRREVSFNSISTSEIVSIISRSRIVIDIEHPSQKGLTMRTLEVLGARKKLVTTNGNVKKYDFYDSANIHVVDRSSPSLCVEFLEQEYKDLDPEIHNKYSLRSWLFNIFGDVSRSEGC